MRDLPYNGGWRERGEGGEKGGRMNDKRDQQVARKGGGEKGGKMNDKRDLLYNSGWREREEDGNGCEEIMKGEWWTSMGQVMKNSEDVERQWRQRWVSHRIMAGDGRSGGTDSRTTEGTQGRGSEEWREHWMTMATKVGPVVEGVVAKIVERPRVPKVTVVKYGEEVKR
ncbi:hypothetical protein K439DRAFT_1623631 [Ramaria rubella]|nr:hypothetical protein K439DRAFT_1623631 [Ramaria rubella]